MSAFTKFNAPTAIVIFGGTGNLAQTKLLPALFDLHMQGALPDAFVVVGLSRKTHTHEEYQQFVRESVAGKGHTYSDEALDTFCSKLRYVTGDFNQLEAYEAVKAELETFDESIHQCTNKLFYLAVPPRFYETIFTHLKDSNAMELCSVPGSWARLLVEKPFGRDLETARSLEEHLCARFDEEQIFRIDHYLAKDSIENLISLRFSNTILASSWNNREIESIHIRLLETRDVATRGSFYDGIGALRDVGQNHMLQILALLTMDRVDVRDPHAMRAARAEVLTQLRLDTEGPMVHGQFEGYTETEGVAEHSTTETYFKFRVFLDDEDWKGVPITLESGKAMAEDRTEAVITFRPVEHLTGVTGDGIGKEQNVLSVTLSPVHDIHLAMWVKQPGFGYRLHKRNLELAHMPATDDYSPEAYERVLYDCIAGDQTRFVSGDEVVAAWEFFTPVMERFSELPLLPYAQGSQGPQPA